MIFFVKKQEVVVFIELSMVLAILVTLMVSVFRFKGYHKVTIVPKEGFVSFDVVREYISHTGTMVLSEVGNIGCLFFKHEMKHLQIIGKSELKVDYAAFSHCGNLTSVYVVALLLKPHHY